MTNFKALLTAIPASLILSSLHAEPLGTAFSYQGQLVQESVSVTGVCDFNFGLWDAETIGSEVATAVDILGANVDQGNFVVKLDFGADAFDGTARWLEIAVVCPAGSGGLTTLVPRQELTVTPHAAYALEAGSMDWAGIGGQPFGLDDGDDVDDADADPANEIQDLSLGGNILSLTNDITPVDLSAYLDNTDTDDQTLAEVLLQGNDAGGSDITNVGQVNAVVVSAGTTAPTYPLQATVTAPGTLSYPLQISNKSNNFSTAVGMVFQTGNDDGEQRSKGAIVYELEDTWNRGDFHILQNTQAGYDVAGLSDAVMTIKNNGWVGIGTDTPAWRLSSADQQPGAVSYPMHVSNKGSTPGTTVGMLFQVDVGEPRGKGAIVYERDGTFNRGDFHILQNTGNNTSVATLADAVMTIKNNGRIGFGASDPSARMELSSANTANTGFNVRNTTSDQRFLIQVNGTSPGSSERVGNLEIWGTGAGGNHNVFTAKSDGSVGIRNQNPQHPLQVGTTVLDGNQAHVTVGGVWTNGSDRASKQNFEPVDRQAILEKVLNLAVTQWQYKSEDASIRHIGPVAQDFYAAFGLGGSDRHIGTIDADGVALAAIQGLHDIVVSKDAELEALRSEGALLKARFESLEALVTGLSSNRK